MTTLGGHGTYRGVLEFTPGVFSGLTVVNSVTLDDYVQGVVPAESPASWPLEALKAQAIAARTYAITTSHGGDLRPVRRHALAGLPRRVRGDARRPTRRWRETRGQVVTYQGQPVTTYFFSTSGGKTEDVENAFSGGVAGALPGVGRGPVRQRLAAPSLDAGDDVAEQGGASCCAGSSRARSGASG